MSEWRIENGNRSRSSRGYVYRYPNGRWCAIRRQWHGRSSLGLSYQWVGTYDSEGAARNAVERSGQGR